MICGVDVSLKTLDARMGPDGPSSCFNNDSKGIAKLAQFCRDHKTRLVAMEATGGYEKKPFALLWAGGIEVAIVNPRAVRDFAKGMGLLEKTDKIDAGIIAWYAETKRCVALKPSSAQQQQLKALVVRLRQLTEMKAAQGNQRRLIEDKVVLRSFRQLLKLIQQQIRELEVKIAQFIAADPLWKELDQAFRTIKGVADRTVARLMAEMPEIGTVSNKRISKLAGLAPLACDSGQHKGKRSVRGGRRTIREILFVIARGVARHNPDFQAFQQRLTKAGKAKKVVRIALAHKLLVRLNAKAREIRQGWQTTADPALAHCP
jgi:transposase